MDTISLKKYIFENNKIEYKEFYYFLLNKPKGYLSATEDSFQPTILDFFSNYSSTSSSGRPSAAPMAAGMPNPMVPMPPEERKRLGRLWRKYCAAHIWCCPTSVATAVFSPRCLYANRLAFTSRASFTAS